MATPTCPHFTPGLEHDRHEIRISVASSSSSDEGANTMTSNIAPQISKQMRVKEAV